MKGSLNQDCTSCQTGSSRLSQVRMYLQCIRLWHSALGQGWENGGGSALITQSCKWVSLQAGEGKNVGLGSDKPPCNPCSETYQLSNNGKLPDPLFIHL